MHHYVGFLQIGSHICTMPEGAQRPSASTFISGPKLKVTALLAYIVTDTDIDCGRYFNVFIPPNVSMMYLIVLILIMGSELG